MSVGALLAFLISNGPSLIAAGAQVAELVNEFMSQFAHRGTSGTVTREEFDAFVDKCLGDKAEIQAIVDAARKEIV